MVEPVLSVARPSRPCSFVHTEHSPAVSAQLKALPPEAASVVICLVQQAAHLQTNLMVCAVQLGAQLIGRVVEHDLVVAAPGASPCRAGRLPPLNCFAELPPRGCETYRTVRRYREWPSTRQRSPVPPSMYTP